jgi:hypothetical protein
MKTCNNKTGNGGWVAGLRTIGLPFMAAAVIIMSGCASLQSITVTPPAKTVFGQGEEFTYEGLQVAGVTKKGDTDTISSEYWMITGYDPDRIGEQTITVNYHKPGFIGSQDFTATYTVTVIGVENIVIDQAPAIARQGMDIDRSDLRITASYGDKAASRSVQGDKVNISAYDKDTIGAQTVTAEYYGKTATFAVTVAALTGIRITTPPARASYFMGEPLDLTGLEATGTWQDAGEATVTPEYVSGFDTNTQGEQTVIVEALGRQVSLTVTVKEPADPAAWTPVTGTFAKNITGIVYGNGIFVAAGYDDDKPNEGIIAYSTDGIIWVKASYPKAWEDSPGRTVKVANFKIDNIFFGGGKFLVSGLAEVAATSYRAAHTRNFVIESSEGVSWSELKATGLGDDGDVVVCTGMAYGDDRWVAVFNGGWVLEARRSGTARDGSAQVDGALDWRTVPPPIRPGGGQPVWKWNRSFRCIFFDGDRLIVLDGAGKYIYLAETGGRRLWQEGEETVAINGRLISEVAYGNGKFIGVAGSNTLGWSTDGIIWTDADQDEGLRGINLNSAAYGFGMFIAAGSRGNIVYSRDGYTWTKVASSTFGSTDIRDIAYGGGKFVAVGDNGRIAYSNRID